MADGQVIRASPVPLYKQVAAIVTDRIERRVYGRRLPSTHALARELDVSQDTVHRAMKLLVKEDRVVISTGLGTFVRR